MLRSPKPKAFLSLWRLWPLAQSSMPTKPANLEARPDAPDQPLGSLLDAGSRRSFPVIDTKPRTSSFPSTACNPQEMDSNRPWSPRSIPCASITSRANSGALSGLSAPLERLLKHGPMSALPISRVGPTGRIAARFSSGLNMRMTAARLVRSASALGSSRIKPRVRAYRFLARKGREIQPFVENGRLVPVAAEYRKTGSHSLSRALPWPRLSHMSEFTFHGPAWTGFGIGRGDAGCGHPSLGAALCSLWPSRRRPG